MSLDPKDPDVPTTYSIDWRRHLIGEALRETEYLSGAFVRPERTTGFYYECTTGGLTKARYPVWPRVSGETVQDGSAVWTARHPDDATVPTVASATWDVPAGITLDSQDETDTHTHITLSGGTDGEDYDLTCRMTDSAGTVYEQTITVQVREA